VRTGQIIEKLARCNLQAGQHTSYSLLKRWIEDLRLSKLPYSCQEHQESCRSCMQYNRQRNQAKRQDTLCLKDRENELTCTDNADRLFEALLGCNFQLADKTLDTAETIWTLKDDIMTAIENDRVPDLHNINLSLEHIRMTVE
jgi:hypothetical protein